MTPEKATKVLEAFVLRARRVLSHSLVTDHPDVMKKLHGAEHTLAVEKNNSTGESSMVLVRDYFPDEEAMESLAARLRPIILASEPIYYGTVLQAIETLIPADDLLKVTTMTEWKAEWDRVALRKDPAPQAYTVITAEGTVNDRDLLYVWLYNDLVHADGKEDVLAKGLGLDHRYRAAAEVVARIVKIVAATLGLITALTKAGLLTLDQAALERDVVVKEPNVRVPIQAKHAPVGTALPTDLSDLDPEVWKLRVRSIFEACRLRGACPSRRAVLRCTDQTTRNADMRLRIPNRARVRRGQERRPGRGRARAFLCRKRFRCARRAWTAASWSVCRP